MALLHQFMHQFILFFLLLTFSSISYADLVKPALIEINVNKQGHVAIEIRASIEALLTGINGRYKNTKDAPNAAEYDHLRQMSSEQLLPEFEKFKVNFLNKIYLEDNQQHKIPLSLSKVEIPERGYTKVPRISVISVQGQVDLSTQSVRWYYPLSFGDYAVRLRQVDLEKQKFHWSEWQWVRSDEPSDLMSITEIVARKPLINTIGNYIELGYKHILPKGTDHILFIFGLFLFSSAFRPLLWQITMFTIAHTITLGLAMNGVFDLPERIVQPLIALSIVYVGVENVFNNGLQKSRLALVFGFGLLHGLGFASMLADFGMPEGAFVTALISFNIGVELGQLSILFGAFLLIGLWFGQRAWYKTLVINPASIMIALIAFYWFIDRLALFT
ncbi:MAG TPA: HupE/UreJ family protein [Thiothrix sp.]|nr:HupE/UreJ family protein [Thiothrix sp.]